MFKPTEKIFREIGLFLHDHFHVTPNGLSHARIFATPWIVLLIVESIKAQSIFLGVITIVIYTGVVLTDAIDGPLARALSRSKQDPNHPHDMKPGAILDRISDKLLIVFCLIPFGVNVFIVLIIFGEGLLAYQALLSKTLKRKQATYVGKIKMLLQTILIPIMLIAYVIGNNTMDIAVNVLLVTTAIFTLLSVISHYKR